MRASRNRRLRGHGPRGLGSYTGRLCCKGSVKPRLSLSYSRVAGLAQALLDASAALLTMGDPLGPGALPHHSASAATCRVAPRIQICTCDKHAPRHVADRRGRRLSGDIWPRL